MNWYRGSLVGSTSARYLWSCNIELASLFLERRGSVVASVLLLCGLVKTTCL